MNFTSDTLNMGGFFLYIQKTPEKIGGFFYRKSGRICSTSNQIQVSDKTRRYAANHL